MLDTNEAKDFFQVGLFRTAARAFSDDVVNACSLQTRDGTQLSACIIQVERLMKEGCTSSNMIPWTGHASAQNPFLPLACCLTVSKRGQLNQRRKKLT